MNKEEFDISSVIINAVDLMNEVNIVKFYERVKGIMSIAENNI